ncbi:hypothetical protein ACFLX2_00155 [Candidatus Dependentiae bacterium]
MRFVTQALLRGFRHIMFFKNSFFISLSLLLLCSTAAYGCRFLAALFPRGESQWEREQREREEEDERWRQEEEQRRVERQRHQRAFPFDVRRLFRQHKELTDDSSQPSMRNLPFGQDHPTAKQFREICSKCGACRGFSFYDAIERVVAMDPSKLDEACWTLRELTRFRQLEFCLDLALHGGKNMIRSDKMTRDERNFIQLWQFGDENDLYHCCLPPNIDAALASIKEAMDVVEDSIFSESSTPDRGDTFAYCKMYSLRRKIENEYGAERREQLSLDLRRAIVLYNGLRDRGENQHVVVY